MLFRSRFVYCWIHLFLNQIRYYQKIKNKMVEAIGFSPKTRSRIAPIIILCILFTGHYAQVGLVGCKHPLTETCDENVTPNVVKTCKEGAILPMYRDTCRCLWNRWYDDTIGKESCKPCHEDCHRCTGPDLSECIICKEPKITP